MAAYVLQLVLPLLVEFVMRTKQVNVKEGGCVYVGGCNKI